MHGGPVLVQQDGQAVPEFGSIIHDYIPESSPMVLDKSIESLSTRSSKFFTIGPIGTSAIASGQPSAVEHAEIVDMTSEDDEDPKMDIEIVDLTSDSD
ncbi:hypothetical protein AHAS_Ahas14G0130100 [Arachis hypogaea]